MSKNGIPTSKRLLQRPFASIVAVIAMTGSRCIRAGVVDRMSAARLRDRMCSYVLCVTEKVETQD